MIKFFRRLRLDALSRKRIPKYIAYAVGEIVLVVIGILIALSINTWNTTKVDAKIEQGILKEIANGLDYDLTDIGHNIEGHKNGLKAREYWNQIVHNQPVYADSVALYYKYLTRNFIALQNTSSYQSLKSKGLELIANDSLRLQIISLYEVDYETVKVFEENYEELQFQKNYFKDINELVSSNLVFDADGNIETIDLPLQLSESEKKEFLSYLWKIKKGREDAIDIYADVTQNIKGLQVNINKYLSKD
jgi:hypothetical protein